MRSGPRNVPRSLNVEYYRQRASAGLMVSEGAPVSPYGHGYYDTPGLHTLEQAAGWKRIVAAVHAEGGKIFLQLWHVGRMSHSDLQPNGTSPVGPSALSSPDVAYTPAGPKPHPVPRALETDEVRSIVGEFQRAAELAQLAGADGVEVHGANGYLLEQFLADGSNHRSDEYGGSVENRSRLLLEVVEAVSRIYGAERVGVRLSPANRHGGIHDSDRWGTWSYAVQRVAALKPAYLHLVEPRVDDSQDINSPDESLYSSRFRPFLPDTTRLISAGGYALSSAEQAVSSGQADLVAFGRLFLANPDLPKRFAVKAALNPYDRSTFYGGDIRGYTDYPALSESRCEVCS
jgi:N-ethylmaleimide reductase